MQGLPEGYSQNDVMAALAAASQKKKAPTVAYADVAHDELTAPGSFDGAPVNTRKLVCPREGCGSVIIGARSAALVECDGEILPNVEGAPFPPPGNTRYWRIDGGPYAFDNIGYSRNVQATLPSGAPGADEGKVKWLICAECDIGPLGWSTEGGQSSWIAVDRVRYSVPESKEAPKALGA